MLNKAFDQSHIATAAAASEGDDGSSSTVYVINTRYDIQYLHSYTRIHDVMLPCVYMFVPLAGGMHGVDMPM